MQNSHNLKIIIYTLGIVFFIHTSICICDVLCTYFCKQGVLLWNYCDKYYNSFEFLLKNFYSVTEWITQFVLTSFGGIQIQLKKVEILQIVIEGRW